MSNNMLAVQPPIQSSNKKITPNILPCRIRHDGPVAVSKRYWDPIFDGEKEDTATAYFRGRKLRGRQVSLPNGYKGLVVTPTDKILKQKESEQQRGHQDENLDELDEEGNEIGSSDASATTRILENQGSFDNLMIWEHEKVPGTDDVFVKGVQEWIQFAEAMHGDKPSSS